MQAEEGVIKYRLDFERTTLDKSFPIADLQWWFSRCRVAGLIGQNPALYEGYAYGNISQRIDQGFLISATQTGGLDSLQFGHISWVTAFSIDSNRLSACGSLPPSSEAMTHGQIYQLRPRCHFIIHVHSPALWNNAQVLGIPVTEPAAEYGTPEMAHEVERLLNSDQLADAGVFSMGGHEDGVVAFGNDAATAGNILFQALNQALNKVDGQHSTGN